MHQANVDFDPPGAGGKGLPGVGAQIGQNLLQLQLQLRRVGRRGSDCYPMSVRSRRFTVSRQARRCHRVRFVAARAIAAHRRSIHAPRAGLRVGLARCGPHSRARATQGCCAGRCDEWRCPPSSAVRGHWSMADCWRLASGRRACSARNLRQAGGWVCTIDAELSSVSHCCTMNASCLSGS